MSSLVVSVTRISKIRSHSNADKLEIAEVLGWQVVVGKGQFHEGDRVVFFPPDCVLPQHQSDRFNVTKYLASGRVKCAKLRGEPSYGLVVKPDDETWEDGKNVADHYGATKYIPPVRTVAEDAEEDHPLFYKYTHIENMRNFPAVLSAGEEIVAVEKCDGTSCRVGLVENVFMAGSHDLRRKPVKTVEDKLKELLVLSTIWRRETLVDSSGGFKHPAYQKIIGLGKDIVPTLLQHLQESPDWWFNALHAILKDGPEITEEVAGRLDELAKLWVAWGKQHGYDRPVAERVSLYWLPLDEKHYPHAANVRKLLTEMAGQNGQNPVILYGEVFGPKVQDFNYGRKTRDFCAFDFSSNGRYFNHDEFTELCGDYGVPTMPVVYRGPFDLEVIRKLADEKSVLGGDRYREGVVVRPVKERKQEFGGTTQRMILKYKGDRFLTGDHTDYKDS